MSIIKKPTSPVACRWWGGNRASKLIRFKDGSTEVKNPKLPLCDHPRLWHRFRARTCAEIRGAGACPYGQELEVNHDGN